MLTPDTLKVAYASDLHLDFEDITDSFFEPIADVLVLAGDVGEWRIWSRQLDFFRRCSEQFPEVIVIAGNHEFYHGKFPGDYEKMREFLHRNFSNVTFLQNQTLEYKGHVFIGTTLWTDFNKGDPLCRHYAGLSMNDYRVIRQDDLGYTKLRPDRLMMEHRVSKNFIVDTLKNTTKPCIVVSHHAPSSLSIHPNYIGDIHLNGAYASDLTDLMFEHQNLKAWIHGHVHNKPHSYTIENCTVYTNTRGYPGEAPPERRRSFQPQVIELSVENAG